MSDTTPRLQLAQLVSMQALNADTWNEALAQLDAFVDLCLKGQFVNTPPASPADGDAYLIGGAPTGAWSGYACKIASCLDGAWRFYTPFDGLRAYVAPTGAFIVYLNGQWADWNSLISANEVSTASAATCDLGAANALFVQITGTTTIASFGTAADKLRFVRFAQALTLTHNAASLVLLGGASRITAAGDVGLYASDASGNWRERSYFRAAINPGDTATKSGGETLSGKTFSGATYFPGNSIIDASGNIGLGTNTPGDRIETTGAIAISGLSSWVFNPSRGRLYKDSVYGMSFIGTTGTAFDLSFVTPAGGCALGVPTGSQNVAIATASGDQNNGALSIGGLIFRTGNGGLTVRNHIYPRDANSCNLGSATYYWANGYIQNAWTVVSDESLKAEIASMSEAEIAVAKEIAPLIVTYKMKAAIAEKGGAAARKHCGWIAQRIAAAFQARGLDPFAYGCVGFDPAFKTAAAVKQIAVPRRDAGGNAVLDGEGNRIVDNLAQTVEETVPDLDETGVQRKRYSIRPDEVTAFALAGLAARLAALESR